MYLNIHDVNPYIRVAMQSIWPAGNELKRRVIFDYELIYMERGEWVVHYDERAYPCAAGQFILFRPGVPHSLTDAKGEVSQPHIHFDIVYSAKSSKTPVSFKDICDFTPEEHSLLQADVFAGYPQIPFVTFSDKQAALELFYGIVRDPKASQLTRKARLTQLIDMLVSDNFPDCFTKEEGGYHIAQQLKDYIDTGQGITAQLSDFEKQFSYSKYYLERQFKKNYGVSLIAYRNNKRMQTAERLLQSETVSGVSEKLGFTSVYVFSRAFKQHFGVSPTKLKEREKSP